MIITSRIYQIRLIFKNLQNYYSHFCVENKYKPNSTNGLLLKIIMANNRYCIDLAKRGTAGCKECNNKIDKGIVRIGKIIPNPFTDSGGEMKQWFHVKCIFTKLSRARATTKKIESTDDLEGWDEIGDEHHPEVLSCLSEFSSNLPSKKTPQKKAVKKNSAGKEPEDSDNPDENEKTEPGPDDTFRQFRKICTEITNNPKYTDKTAILSRFFKKGHNGEGFKGDLYLWIKMLLPAVEKRVYNLQTTQIIKIFSKIFKVPHELMTEDFEKGEIAGDVSETVRVFFEQSKSCPPVKKSTLYLQEVDEFLAKLSKTGQEVEQIQILTKVAKKCTGNDLKYFMRFIKHDLRFNAGPKHILGALNPNAYEAFQASRDLKAIVKRAIKSMKSGKDDELDVRLSLMTPVLPMLASACKDLETPFKKYPEGFYVEVKYDGERVQLHKRGTEFSYFSRSLKPVMPHKVSHLKDYIPKAFPYGNDLMLDCEILLVDNVGNPLPFGTLGAHRKTAFKDATVCLFVFDCLQFNDENLMDKPLVERRKILEENMIPVEKHILFSELKEIKSRRDLQIIVDSVIDQGLEGLVIKSKNGVYEPGKRHWLKLKKDYLKDKHGRGMADSADLVVLGGYYGTGRKGGLMSVFLMGCYDEKTRKWCTVTKVPGGDDKTLDELQESLLMQKISKDLSEVPSWLNINKGVLPDFITADPKESPVWEISGAEFTKAEVHTASGISIRFPRIKRVRTDKTWETATTLSELKDLFEASKVKSDIIGLKAVDNAEDDNDEDDVDNMNDSANSSASPATSPKKRSPDSNQNSSKKVKKEIKMESPEPKAKEGKSSELQKGKRKSDDDSTPKKKVKSESSGIKSEKKTSQSEPPKDIPDVFLGVKLSIPSSLEEAETLRRYFIAYGGVLLKEYDSLEATHVISTENPSSQSNNAVVVTVDWLWDSIKLQKRLPTEAYNPEL